MTSTWEQLAALPQPQMVNADTALAISEAEEEVEMLRQRLRSAKV